MKNKLSQDQHQTLANLLDWQKNPKTSHVTVGGYAGTGKTTIIALLRRLLYQKNPKLRIAMVAFTGKAAQVLKIKLTHSQAVYGKDHIGTIHSLLYTPAVGSDGKIVDWNKNKKLDLDLIIVDESSMVTRDLWRDLLSFDLPIIAVGDHGQLPPVGDKFNLMVSPTLELKTIHRQGERSKILELAAQARETGEIKAGEYSSNVIKLSKTSPEAQDIMESVVGFGKEHDSYLVMCGRNKTRIELNRHIRALRGIESEIPIKGDKVICLRNNYNAEGGPIFNGMTGVIDDIHNNGEHWYSAVINFLDTQQTFDDKISRHQFDNLETVHDIEGLKYTEIGDRFDYGYALTVHKAQGSQAQSVVLFEEKSSYSTEEDWRRWLYTAVTRAEEKLYILA